MSDNKMLPWTCPLPEMLHKEITLAHGSGGTMTHQLIDELFKPAFDNAHLNADLDGAVFKVDQSQLAFTTDSYVVKPCFFPGGDIGSMAVHGTVNDLAMCGAQPLYLSVGFIIEEGFLMKDLHRVVRSMSAAAHQAGVQLVTGDTKVVDKGCGDGLFINTSGIGAIKHGQTLSPESIRPGDKVIVSGDIGRHGMAVMSVREGLQFRNPVVSDTASVSEVVQSLLVEDLPLRCLRDPTRGGVATSLVEIARKAKLGIVLDEAHVPVSDGVRGACEILGLEPLYVASEGRFLVIVPESAAAQCVSQLRQFDACESASVIGTVTQKHPGMVSLITPIGGRRALDMLSGEQLPRIC